MSDRCILMGIDEAGYGPLLGPLVVSASVFEGPASWGSESLWKVLRQSVCTKADDRRRRLPICDSKVLYKADEGLRRLERTALSALQSSLGVFSSGRAILGALCPGIVAKLDEYPWYRGADIQLPIDNDPAAIAIASASLDRDLQSQGGRLAAFHVEVLPEGHFNESVARTQSKASVLMGLTFRLIDRVARAFPGHDLIVRVDRQGGRTAYGHNLMRSFEDKHLKIAAEAETHSRYELREGDSRWEISFDVEGETKHLPIALASIISKYIREVLMRIFNAYWQQHAPGIRPTAGYYTDGTRFFKDIEPHLLRLGIRHDRLLRSR